MKKAIFVMLLALLYAKPSVAQTDSLRREIGFSTQIIFDNIFESGGAPFELMLKKRKGDNSWMRYGLGLSASSHNYKGPDTNDQKQTNSHILISPSVGFEKRKNLSERWSILYGGDFFASFSYRNSVSHYHNDTTNDRDKNIDKVYNTSAGIRPLIGLIFNLTPRLYLSTEASANISAFLMNRRHHYFAGTPDSSETEDKTWGYNFNFRPASAIFVYYRF